MPADLRKHIKSGHNTAICSLTGSMIVNIGNEITISIGFKGGNLQLQKANKLLNDLKTELENIN